MTSLYLSRVHLRTGHTSAAATPLKTKSAGARVEPIQHLIALLFHNNPAAAREFLWRDEGADRFMLLSPQPPDTRSSQFDVETALWSPALDLDTAWRFSLRVNPTVARKVAFAAVPAGKRARGERVDVIIDALDKLPPAERAAQRERLSAELGRVWLDEQGKRAGFSVQSASIRLYDPSVDKKTSHKQRQAQASVSIVDMSGVLTITDPVMLRTKMAVGFGAAKAFGNGLLLLEPA